ncbi:hypothetical protein D3C83_264390 [compost metagenome]
MVKRVVRPRRELVHEQLAVREDEHLDGEQSDDTELLGDRAREHLGVAFEVAGDT